MDSNHEQNFQERLQAERPRLTDGELDETAHRILARGGQGRRSFVGSRLLLTGVLVCGLLLSTAGAGLAISGAAGAGNAASVQYANPGVPGAQGVLGVSAKGRGDPSGRANPEIGIASGLGAQITRQVAVSDPGKLPFTGYAGIVGFLLGLGLLGAGLMLRRTTSSLHS